jgi:putative peptidoglycan lipid II flippase
MALSLPLMRIVAFGQASENGPQLLSAALAALAAGLFPYGALLLFARAMYAQGDSRTPAIVAIASAVVGVAIIALGVPFTDGSARVALLGVGHSSAYLVGAVVLGVLLGRRTGHALSLRSAAIALACAVPPAVAGWLVADAIAPQGRVGSVLVVAGCGAGVAACYGVAMRRWWPRTSS